MDGILIVDKPQGMTSHDVVDVVRRIFGTRRVGHAGTLDPMATGVLVVLLGKCTKASGSLLADDKEYEATMVLGAVSDTGDAYGKVTPSGRAVPSDREAVEKVFRGFTGRIKQSPPMYSAVRYAGTKLYEFARKGETVDVIPREVHIKRLEITAMAFPEISFRVLCSKGTYIRKLCMDIGDALGCGAYLTHLRRIASGKFRLDGAVTLEELKALGREAAAERLECI
jgi:tRNA pseudouridine55 synthase